MTDTEATLLVCHQEIRDAYVILNSIEVYDLDGPRARSIIKVLSYLLGCMQLIEHSVSVAKPVG